MQHRLPTENEAPAAVSSVEAKGLKRDAVSLLSSVVIGVSSAAPASSLASALGLVTASAACAAPAVLLVAFLPMLCMATAYFYLNRADPDCGTTFAWVTRAAGPHAGFVGGWALIATGIIVMPSLGVIAAQYSFQLVGIVEPSAAALFIAGVGWIALMTAICYFGIDLSARTQLFLLATELAILAIFAGAALAKVYLGGASAQSLFPASAWFNPFAVQSVDAFAEAVLVAVFIYWGWDASVSINEETTDPRSSPGWAALFSTVLLLAVYLLVTVAAIAFAGPGLLSDHKEDVFAPIGVSVLGPWLQALLVIAVLTSAAAAAQTTVLTAARTALSMAAAGAIPREFATIHPRYFSPSFATIAVGAVSVAWYAGLALVSKNVLDDSVRALGLCIAFYYALTAYACVALHRGVLARSLKNFVLMGAIPALGALAMLLLFIRSCLSLASATTSTILGIGTPLVVGLGSLLLGAALMMALRKRHRSFFKRGITPAFTRDGIHDAG